MYDHLDLYLKIGTGFTTTPYGLIDFFLGIIVQGRFVGSSTFSYYLHIYKLLTLKEMTYNLNIQIINRLGLHSLLNNPNGFNDYLYCLNESETISPILSP